MVGPGGALVRPFIRQPERESWGAIVASLVDPDGTTVRLFELPD